MDGFTSISRDRDQASPSSTREARGPHSLAAWNGMGPCGYHKPPSTYLPISTGIYCYYYAILILLAVLMTVTAAFPQGGGSKCQVEQCEIAFYQARENLDIDDYAQHEAECKALRSYRHCITKAEAGCYGDLSYHSHRNMATKLIQTNNCSSPPDSNSNGGGGGNEKESRPEPEELEKKPARKPIVPAMCMFQGAKVFRHCSLFGDPHLRTFYEEFQTCKVKGAWPLINNDYLAVQVTNAPVEGNTDATATSKLTVIVKGNAECTTKDFQTYQAQTNSLPSTFEDGRVSYGPYQGLELVEIEPGKHVEIHIRYIETVIIIRQIGRYFTFSIKMPEELLNKSSSTSKDLQLCARGCPAAEQIRYKEYLANRNQTLFQYAAKTVSISEEVGKTSLTWEYAEKVCRDAKLVDFYFDSCVFDLMATGDLNFTLSALGALQDMVRLNPSATKSWVNRAWLTDSRGNSANGGSPSSLSASSLQRSQYSFHRLHIVSLLLLTCVIKVLLREK